MIISFTLLGSPLFSYAPIPIKRDLSNSRRLVKDGGQLETIPKFGYSNSSLISQVAYRSDIKDDFSNYAFKDFRAKETSATWLGIYSRFV